MTEPHILMHASPEDFASAILGDVKRSIRSAVAERGQAVVAFPGGATPRPIFAQLSHVPLPWDKTTIIPTDERIVEPGDGLSNAAALVREFSATGAAIVPLVTRVDDYLAAGERADQAIRELAWPLDLVWLGMGADGHIASIFDGPDLANALDAPEGRRIVAVRPGDLPSQAPVPRVTLTAAAIRSARSILVTITGRRKREVIESALADGAKSELPIGRVLGGSGLPFTIRWCCE